MTDDERIAYEAGLAMLDRAELATRLALAYSGGELDKVRSMVSAGHGMFGSRFFKTAIMAIKDVIGPRRLIVKPAGIENGTQQYQKNFWAVATVLVSDMEPDAFMEWALCNFWVEFNIQSSEQG